VGREQRIREESFEAPTSGRGSQFLPYTAVGTAFGFVRMGLIDDGLCIAALCVRHGADTCWECIAPGQVLTDPTAFYYESLDELRSLIGVTVR
jgi:hypothetical protein